MPFDLVKYVGRKLSGEIGLKIGEVVAKVGNEDNVYTVDFDGDSFIVSGANLAKPSKAEIDRAEKQSREAPKRRKKDDDEV